MANEGTISGHCACGAVSFRASGPFRDAIACHCRSCRHQSGHYLAATATAIGNVAIDGADGLTWYASTPHARRAFCRTCGSLMFWEPASGEHMSIMMGAVDDPGDIRLTGHIFISEKGTYYEIGDGLPQKDRG